MKPTIGRVVHFWPDHPVDEPDLAKPFPMVIAFVHNDRLVNLGGWDHNGDHCSATSVPLLQDGDLIPRGGFYAAWPQHAAVVTDKPGTEPVARAMYPGRPAAVVIDDVSMEAEIQAKGLTAARVTPADIEANIASEHYFTAYGGAKYRRITRDEPRDGDALKLLTFCVLVLRNGFTVTGESACASPANFDADMGCKIARANAVNKVWPLMGYELKQRLAAESASA